MAELSVLQIAGAVIAVAAAAVAARWWVLTYNGLQGLYNRAAQKFSEIDPVMQGRVDILPALLAEVKKIDEKQHEALMESVGMRMRWLKDEPLNEKARSVQDIEDALIKIQALLGQRRGKGKAKRQAKAFSPDFSKSDYKLREAKAAYNKIVEQYNERVTMFPTDIVASVHRFVKLDYL